MYACLIAFVLTRGAGRLQRAAAPHLVWPLRPADGFEPLELRARRDLPLLHPLSHNLSGGCGVWGVGVDGGVRLSMAVRGHV